MRDSSHKRIATAAFAASVAVVVTVLSAASLAATSAAAAAVATVASAASAEVVAPAAFAADMQLTYLVQLQELELAEERRQLCLLPLVASEFRTCDTSNSLRTDDRYSQDISNHQVVSFETHALQWDPRCLDGPLRTFGKTDSSQTASRHT